MTDWVLVALAIIWTLVSALQIGSILEKWQELGPIIGTILILVYVLSIGWVGSKVKD